MASFEIEKFDGDERQLAFHCSEMWIELSRLLKKFNVRVKVEKITLSPKEFRAMHLWFRQCEKELNAHGSFRYSELSGKKTPWQEGDFKHAFKKFIKAYAGLDSTKEQSHNILDEAVKALTAHIIEIENVTLPDFPSLELMSVNHMLKHL